MNSLEFYLKPCNRTLLQLAETIAGIEQVLTEILVRVPARPLVRFKCVSKHWLSLISDPKFCHRHTLQNPNPPISAIFPDRSTKSSVIPFPRDHSNQISPNWNPFQVLTDHYGDIVIVNSCNGLFLCHPLLAEPTQRFPYFVLNPTTNRFLTLAIPPLQSHNQPFQTQIIGCFLAFDPSKSPHYKLICLETFGEQKFSMYYMMQIYSSESRSWRCLNTPFCMRPRIGYEQGLYSNGAIHWVGLYGEMSYFHIDEERVEYVKTTDHCYQKNWRGREFRYFRVTNGGHLHLIDIYRPYTSFEVLEMGRDYSGWFIKYHVDLDPWCASMRNLAHGVYVVLFLDRDENSEDSDSLSLFLHTPRNVISYNLKSKILKSFPLATHQQSLIVDYRNYMYKETLACV